MISRVSNRLSLCLSWLSTDHLAVAVSIFYGGFIWAFHSFAVSSAFSALTGNISSRGIPPEPIFAIPLLLGAGVHAFGIRCQSHGWMLTGILFSFAVFAAALISCWLTVSNGTGVPAYAGYCLAYAVLALRHATGNQWIPLS